MTDGPEDRTPGSIPAGADVRVPEQDPDPAGRLGIVVVNYGSHDLLETHLGAMDLGGLPVHVVVVDNFSTAAEREVVAALAGARGWTFVGLPDNRGFGAGVNAGVRAARAAGCVTFLLLNPDASVAPGVVGELRRHSLREPMALISPRIVAPDGTVFFDGAELFTDSGRLRGRRTGTTPSGPGRTRPSGPATEWVTGACLVVHDQLLRRAGELDESFFLYWEDVEFSHRCRAAGGALVVRSDLEAVHDAGGTQGPTPGRAKSAVYYRYNCRNRLLFAARWSSRRELLRWMWATPAVSWEVLLRGGRRQLLHQPALALAAIRGSASGLVLAAGALLRGRRRTARTGPSVLVVHPGAELYGSDRMLVESVAGLVDRGERVTVALPVAGPLVGELEATGATVVRCRMPVLRKSATTPRGAAALLADAAAGLLPAWRLLRRTGPGPVYVNTLTIPLWPMLARLVGRHVTLHVHEAEDGAPAPVRRALALPAVFAQRVLVNSRYSRDVLAASLSRTASRAVVVPNGVVGPEVTVPPRPRLSTPVRLLFVGRLSPRKGPQVALAVLAELSRRGVDARLTLAGSTFPGYEWFEADLRAQVERAESAPRVDFLGFVPDVQAVLSDSDVVLVPSVLPEPFGNTAVEAVLAARPVIVSAAGGLPEAIDGHTSAQGVPPGDVAAWADAVQRVIAAWPRFAAAAQVDAGQARARHAPARYRAEVARLITIPGEERR